MVLQGFWGGNCHIYREYIYRNATRTLYRVLSGAGIFFRTFRDHFQLQFGMSAPEPVRARFWVPSASMVMMRWWLSAPSGELAKAMWRPSGDQVGKSQRPISWVS